MLCLPKITVKVNFSMLLPARFGTSIGPGITKFCLRHAQIRMIWTKVFLGNNCKAIVLIFVVFLCKCCTGVCLMTLVLFVSS
jgi:hypothetical protein